MPDPNMPAPTGCHAAPSHVAAPRAGRPPARVKEPRAYNRDPLPSSANPTPFTIPFVPLPTADHPKAVNRARYGADTLPTVLNAPPMYNSPPPGAAAKEYTSGVPVPQPTFPPGGASHVPPRQRASP